MDLSVVLLMCPLVEATVVSDRVFLPGVPCAKARLSDFGSASELVLGTCLGSTPSFNLGSSLSDFSLRSPAFKRACRVVSDRSLSVLFNLSLGGYESGFPLLRFKLAPGLAPLVCLLVFNIHCDLRSVLARG